MRDTLRPGLEATFRYRVPDSKTVPRIYDEAADFQLMPRVLATGYMVALVEWACIELIKPHLDWPREQSLGTHVDLSHTAATPAGFTVEVRTRLQSVEGRKLVITVTDHGPGIPQAELERVFEKFHRVAPGDGRPAGTGLGLSICRGLIGAMDGTIRAESPLLDGAGTRIVIELPIAEARQDRLAS